MAASRGRVLLSMAASTEHTVLVPMDGSFLAWPRGGAPLRLTDHLDAMVAVAAGGTFAAAVDASEQVWVWGRGARGELGDAHSALAEPTCLSGLPRVSHALASAPPVVVLIVHLGLLNFLTTSRSSGQRRPAEY